MESNKLIAEFMGYEIYPDNNCDTFNGKENSVRDLNFMFNDWNELMRVVEKIEDNYDTEYVHLVPQFEDDTKYQFRIFVSNTNVNGDNKRECFYKAVVEFIKWHNQNKEDLL